MNAIDKAIDDLGAVWSIGEAIGYMIERDMLYKFEGHQPGYICTKREFEARVKERNNVTSPVGFVGEKGDIDENFVPTGSGDMSRIDIIGQNGNSGEHYDKPTHPVTAVDFFTAGAEILNQRGQQYDSKGEAERSFPQVAQAFTAITGRQLSGSDVCLVLNLVKKVRQYAQPDRLHHDSLLDSVNYDALWAQELTRELTGGKP